MISRDFFNERAARWDATVAERDASRLERLAGRLELGAGDTVLDVGTGTGVLIPYILARIGDSGRVVAVDFAGAMLQIARAKGFGPRVEYLCADVIRIPAESATFDSIICYSSFPHFQDKAAALVEINRVAKRGGRLLIGHTSSRESINKMHRQIPGVRHDLIPNAEEMRSLLKAAGFTDIRIADEPESYLASAKKP